MWKSSGAFKGGFREVDSTRVDVSGGTVQMCKEERANAHMMGREDKEHEQGQRGHYKAAGGRWKSGKARLSVNALGNGSRGTILHL